MLNHHMMSRSLSCSCIQRSPAVVRTVRCTVYKVVDTSLYVDLVLDHVVPVKVGVYRLEYPVWVLRMELSEKHLVALREVLGG